ncbi:MAG: hypothetical protein R3F34_15525 [Planctomycetota bacterium]
MTNEAITKEALHDFYERPEEERAADPRGDAMHAALLQLLESGEVRAAEPDESSEDGWRVNAWVKRAILAGFKRSQIVPMGGCSDLPAFDKAGYPPRRFDMHDGVRVVPGGSAVRRGAHVAKGVVVMPPATSTSARTSVRARWSTATRSSAAARRSVNACTSPLPRRSEVCSNPRARAPSSSRTKRSSAASSACSKA